VKESRRERRIRHTERIIANRLRFLRVFGPDEWYEKNSRERHRLAKRHPWDCGRTSCVWCHCGKVCGTEQKKYKGEKASKD